MPSRLTIACMICMVLNGCAEPLVKYNLIKQPDESGLTKFQLADTANSIRASFRLLERRL